MIFIGCNFWHFIIIFQHLGFHIFILLILDFVRLSQCKSIMENLFASCNHYKHGNLVYGTQELLFCYFVAVTCKMVIHLTLNSVQHPESKMCNTSVSVSHSTNF